MLEDLAVLLLSVSWKVLAVGLLAWGVARFTPLRRRPAAEHALWVAVALTMLCLPAGEAFRQARPEAAYPRISVEIPVGAAIVAPPVVPAAATEHEPVSWLALLACVYLLGLAVASSRLIAAWCGSWSFRLGARPIRDRRSKRCLQRIALGCGLERPPSLLVSDRFAVPVTTGLLRPAIVLPAGFGEWDDTHLRAVLTHECAHVVRRDTFSAWIVAMARAPYWFHPVGWWLGRKSGRLMEQACDDFAIHVLSDAPGYAQALVDTASSEATTETQSIGALAMGSHLSFRVERVLRGGAKGTGVVRRRALGALAMGALAAVSVVHVLTPVWAQQGGITLTGVVVDASGGRVPGASVFLYEPTLNLTEVTVSGSEGTFVIRGLQPSEAYEIEAERGGFARGRQPLSLRESRHIELTLKVGKIHERIIVEADAPDGARAVPATAPKRIRVGGKVQKAKMSVHVKPEYPEDARAEGVEGTVLLEAVISASGAPLSLRTLNDLVDPRLVASAVHAVSQWRYEPTQLNGQPVEVATVITVGFRLRR